MLIVTNFSGGGAPSSFFGSPVLYFREFYQFHSPVCCVPPNRVTKSTDSPHRSPQHGCQQCFGFHFAILQQAQHLMHHLYRGRKIARSTASVYSASITDIWGTVLVQESNLQQRSSLSLYVHQPATKSFDGNVDHSPCELRDIVTVRAIRKSQCRHTNKSMYLYIFKNRFYNPSRAAFALQK
jgi:hypothetical protein